MLTFIDVVKANIAFYLDVLTTCWTAVKPFPVPPIQNHPIIEIAELYPDPQPQTAYINHIYVYPISLAYDTQKNVPRARNITCMVQMFDSDDIDSIPIEVISNIVTPYQFFSILDYTK